MIPSNQYSMTCCKSRTYYQKMVPSSEKNSEICDRSERMCDTEWTRYEYVVAVGHGQM